MAGDLGDDVELFRRLAAGWDAEALGLLYDRHGDRFLIALRRRGFSAEDAEDILQDCFVRLAVAGRGLERVQNPRAYLWRILFNAASDLLTAGRILREAEPYNPGDPESKIQDADFGTDSGAAPETLLDIDACVDRAWSLLEERAPERAQVLEWIVVDGLSGQEVAVLIGRSYGATREYVSQCRRVLRDLLLQTCPDWELDRS